MATAECRARSRSPRRTSVKELLGTRPIINNIPFMKKEYLDCSQNFKAGKGDVFISTYPKTGTTWMQQICHQLRSGGHTDFDEISEESIVPWLEVGPAIGIDISLPQTAAPRVFKTHQTLQSMSHMEVDGAKYLCVVRDPIAALLSQFKFGMSMNEPSATDTRDVNKYVRQANITRGGEGESTRQPTFGSTIWEFYTEFWKCRKQPNVLVIVYENMRKDLSSQLDRIADFLGLPTVTDELRQKVLDLSSMEWMSKNDEKFDDHHMEVRLQKLGMGEKFKAAKKIGLDINDGVTVTTMTPETIDMINSTWKEVVTPVTGHETYTDMIAQL